MKNGEKIDGAEWRILCNGKKIMIQRISLSEAFALERVH